MAQRQKGQKVYKTFQGKQIDMDLLRKKNELTPAVGNARVNARGDELGAGGKIIKKREEVVREYYKGSEPVADEVLSTPVAPEPVQQDTPKKSTRKTTRAQQKEQEVSEPSASELAEFEAMDDQWVEDEEGNFVKR